MIYLRIILLGLFVVSVVSFNNSFEIDGFKYYLSDPLQTNWYQAVRQCTQRGMYLLDLETEQEYLKVQKYMRDHTEEFPHRAYWMSGTSLGTTGEFYWWDSGEEIAYNGFSESVPDNVDGMEFCLEMHKRFDFTFNDIRCSYTNYFICREGKYTPPRNS